MYDPNYDALYEDQRILFSVIVNTFKHKSWKSKKRSDGELCGGGDCFMVGIDTSAGTYGYQYDNEYWDMFDCQILETAPDSRNEVERLLSLQVTPSLTAEKTELGRWSANEIRLLSETCESDEDIQCCNGALNALRSLIDADHSGNSILSSNLILNRLLNYRPLTPIEDTDDLWKRISPSEEEEFKSYQCKRLSSLFKEVHADGTVVYRDINSITCIDIDDSRHQYCSPLVFNILKDMFPITMPYMPIGGTTVYCSDFIMDPKNEEFDTLAIFHAISPGKGRIEINRFFKETEDGTWDELDSSEYNERRILAKEREKNSL